MLLFASLAVTLATTPEPTEPRGPPAAASPFRACAGARLAMVGNRLAAGVEARLDGPLFVRGRAMMGPGSSRELRDTLEQIAEVPIPRRQWIARSAELDVAWAPARQFRVGASFDSHLNMPQGTVDWMQSTLQVVLSTRGVSRVGPTLGAGIARDNWTVLALGTIRTPVASRYTNDDFMAFREDASPYRAAEMHGTQTSVGLEGRFTEGNFAVQVDAGVTRVGNSRYLRDRLRPWMGRRCHDCSGRWLSVWASYSPGCSRTLLATRVGTPR